MQKAFRKISSLFLALIVMTSTLSFSISKHYCSNILVDSAVVQLAKTCGMHDQDNTQKDKHDDKDSCCDDEVKLVEGQDELKVSTIDFNLELPVEFINFSMVFLSSEIHTFKKDTAYQHYRPPEYDPDFQILYQVFLI